MPTKYTRLLTGLSLIVFCSSALSATAYLVSMRMAMSVTGQALLICTYAYGATQFEKAFPMSIGQCPSQIEVQ